MNKQLENIQFFKDNLGIKLYPVADLAGNAVSNLLALVGLSSQTELELCASFLKGKIAEFDRSAEDKFVIVKNDSRKIPGLCSTRGVLVEVAA